MSVHDWSRVKAGIFHHFHQRWIGDICLALNRGMLPEDYYALEEQRAVGFGPDVLTLERIPNEDEDSGSHVKLAGETDLEFYRRKQSSVTVRHASGDGIVAVVEVVSPGNKSGRAALREFVEKAAEFLHNGIHLLVLDLHHPGRLDPNGIHGEIWDDISGQSWSAPADKSLTLASYESDLAVRAYVESIAVGDGLIDMPLFLEPGAHVVVPLEATYQSAFAAVPRRWQRVLEANP